jgi:hypothetical protein
MGWLDSVIPMIERDRERRKNRASKLLKPSDIARQIGKSLRWVYDHGAELGGAKIGRVWIFTKEGFNDAYARQREKTLEGAGKVSTANLPGRLSYKERGHKLGAPKADGTGRVSEDADADRHGLARLLQQVFGSLRTEKHQEGFQRKESFV